MTKYRVYLDTTTVVDVEAEDKAAAEDLVYDNLPYLCAQCSRGWGRGPNLDELIINPDEVRDGYVNEDEGIWQ